VSHIDIEAKLAALDRSQVGIDPADIVEVVESVMASISGDRSGVNHRLYEDIEALVKFIQSAKAEIASIKADEINTKFIPTASDELGAIIGATEEATHAIFEAVETIEGVSDSLPPDVGETVGGAITKIYEACSFQDITGQRITKIVKVLQDVESKVVGLLQALGEEVDAPRDDQPVPAAPAKDDKDLMSGPQLPGNAMSQDDIDALLASFD
jgi:chemotaxis protein CheZ